MGVTHHRVLRSPDFPLTTVRCGPLPSTTAVWPAIALSASSRSLSARSHRVPSRAAPSFGTTGGFADATPEKNFLFLLSALPFFCSKKRLSFIGQQARTHDPGTHEYVLLLFPCCCIPVFVDTCAHAEKKRKPAGAMNVRRVRPCLPQAPLAEPLRQCDRTILSCLSPLLTFSAREKIVPDTICDAASRRLGPTAAPICRGTTRVPKDSRVEHRR